MNLEESMIRPIISLKAMATRRRGVGVGAIQQKQQVQAQYAAKGEELASEQIANFSQQLETFTKKLEDFAYKHRNEIKKNSQFRRHFQEMCAHVGVDPLASSKGFWASKLGVGDFYYELAVQVIEVCLSTNHINGGLITLNDLRTRLLKSRSKTRKENITNDDILRAVQKIKVLGELSMDDSRVLQLAEETGFVTIELIMDRLRWEETRTLQVIEHLIKEGLAWVDEQPSDTNQYWIPSLFLQQYYPIIGSSGSTESSLSSFYVS
ncbi:Vacuolar-sorting protein SNF8 [Strongyloides ratti]|uniref:Vacuolar-sorting protein SNF8 n=1 Tax=Strongyloides ratti TaxID=34506 RepID=A0A090LHI7_STRRB|nr:Vacuolar-sorting protein SNF8 [Strongyloides ratti]CEF67618.1 Vacuolar-sorting protein SNF8 [Strongyloides ratti]